MSNPARGTVVLFVLALAGWVPAQSECPLEWRYGPGQWLPGLGRMHSLNVRAITTWDPDGDGPLPPLLVAAGLFDVAGDTLARNIATWDGQQWRPLGTGTDDNVYALTVFNGDLIASGQFSTAGGLSTDGIARWDGEQWHTFAPGATRPSALTVYNGDLIAGGAGCRRWDGQQWQSLGSASGQIYALCVYDGELVAGGNFSKIGGVSANRIARWNGQQWTAFGSGMDAPVYSLYVQDGRLIAGGLFNTSNGVYTCGLGAWDGTRWQTLWDNCAKDVRSYRYGVAALIAYNGQLIEGGDFPDFIDVSDGTHWNPLGSGVDGPYVLALGLYHGELIVGGNFLVAGGQSVVNIAAWNGAQWRALSTGSATIDFDMVTMTEYQGQVFACGSFHPFGEASAGVVRWDGQAWQAAGTPFIQAFAKLAGDLYGVAAATLYRWDGQTWQAVASYPRATFYCVAAYQGALVAGGYQILPNGQTTGLVARWDGQTWQSMGAVNSHLNALLVYRGDLIAGGQFSAGGDVSGDYIARWDGSHWQSLGTGLDGPVYTLLEHGGDLVAGGNFAAAGGVPASHVARWDGQTWSPLGGGVNKFVNALASYHGELVAGGPFTAADGNSASCIARWDGTAWHPLRGGLDSVHPPEAAGPTVYALQVQDGDLFVGGYFYAVDGKASMCWARWHDGRGDLDQNGVVDSDDFTLLADCLGGPGTPPTGACDCGDFDGDGSIDLADFARFQRAYADRDLRRAQPAGDVIHSGGADSE